MSAQPPIFHTRGREAPRLAIPPTRVDAVEDTPGRPFAPSSLGSRRLPRRLALVCAAVSLACLATALAVACSACSQPFAPDGESLSVLSWNLMTLFDPIDHGSEYADWTVASGEWSESDYRVRLALAAKAILAADEDGPDLVALQELENERVLEDLATGPLAKAGYRWRAVSGDPGSERLALRVGLLSRLPIVAARSHAAATVSGAETGRAVLEVELDYGGEPLVLLICHWKSRSGGAPETEAQRRSQAAMVAALARERLALRPALALLALGDLNEGPEEFDAVAYPTALVPFDRAAERVSPEGRLLFQALPTRVDPSPRLGALVQSGAEPVFLEPWLGAQGFSYAYKGERERLDHILACQALADGAGLELLDFRVAAAPFLYDAEGLPFAWDPVLRDGYSDHLPILAVIGHR